MSNTLDYDFIINGLDVHASYPQQDVIEVYIPLLKKLSKLQNKLNRRLIVFVAAPPGSGKSTLCYFLQYLSQQDDSITELQAIGIDGFHYRTDYLKSVFVNGDSGLTLNDFKGIPDSFDTDALIDKIKNISTSNVLWPSYSRKIHDPVSDQIKVDRNIIVIEGNYLLYTEGQWKELSGYCDFSIFLNMDYSALKQRLISRKVQGGSTKTDAISHFLSVDKRNIQTVLHNRFQADLEILYDKNNSVIMVKENDH